MDTRGLGEALREGMDVLHGGALPDLGAAIATDRSRKARRFAAFSLPVAAAAAFAVMFAPPPAMPDSPALAMAESIISCDRDPLAGSDALLGSFKEESFYLGVVEDLWDSTSHGGMPD